MAKISKVILALALGLSSVAVAEVTFTVNKHKQYDRVEDGEYTVTRYYKTNHAGKVYEHRYEGARDVGADEPLALSPKEAEQRFYALEAEWDARHVKEHPGKCPVYPEKTVIPAGYKPLSDGAHAAPLEMDMDDKVSHAVQKQSAKSAFQIIFGNCSGCACATGKE